MKTTLIIPDPVFRDLKRQALERDETLSALATEYLIVGLRQSRKAKHPFRFPTFKMGPPKVNVADREELYEALEAGRDARLYGRAKRKE